MVFVEPMDVSTSDVWPFSPTQRVQRSASGSRSPLSGLSWRTRPERFVERAQHPGPRRVEGVLHGGVRLGRQTTLTWAEWLYRVEARGQVGCRDDADARHGPGGGASPLARLLRRRRHRCHGRQGHRAWSFCAWFPRPTSRRDALQAVRSRRRDLCRDQDGIGNRRGAERRPRLNDTAILPGHRTLRVGSQWESFLRPIFVSHSGNVNECSNSSWRTVATLCVVSTTNSSSSFRTREVQPLGSPRRTPSVRRLASSVVGSAARQ